MGDPYAEFQNPSAPDPYADFQSAAPAAPPSTPGEAKQSFLSKAATQPSQFGPLNPLRYADELGQGMAQGVQMLQHPIESAKKIYQTVTTPIEHDPSGDVPLSEGLGNVADTLAQGYGQAIVGKVVDEGLGAAGKLRKATAGKAQPLARKITGVETAVKEEVGKAAEKQAGVLEKNKADRLETVRGNLAKQRAANTDITRDKMAIGEKNKAIESANKAQAEQVARRGELAKTVDQQSNELGEHISKVEASVGREANQKFEQVRAKIGNPEVDAQPLVDLVKSVKTDILQDIPENVKEFNAVLRHEAPPEFVADAYEKAVGEPLEGPDPLTWNKLQSIKSRVDARLRAARTRPMNGDLKRALYSVREGVVDAMGTAAEANGAGAEWAEAKDFWRNYKQDFHEPTGPSGSGSPVAQALDAVDPKNIRQPFLRTQATTGNRATEILRKYPQHGGTEAATHAEGLIKSHQEMMGLPEKLAPKALKQYPESHQMPTPKEAPRIPEAPTVDINKVAKEAIAAKAKNWGSFNARDVGIIGSSVVAGLIAGQLERGVVAAVGFEGTKFGAARLLNKPAVIDWLAKTPPEEIAAINKIPGADKVRVVDGLTDAAVEAAKSGKLSRLSPEVRRLIGPANVARIMAVTGATQVSTPGEAKDRARQFAPTP